MTRTQISAIAVAVSTLFAGSAMAATDAPMTRAQVQAELTDAIRSGDMIISESGVRMNQAFPQNYANNSAASTVTRSDVQVELADAIRTGNQVIGESSTKLNEAFPYDYAGGQDYAGKSRDDVRSELAEAAQTGKLYRHIEA